MLSISNPMKGAGRGEYYLKLAREDYYAKGAEEPGRWSGSGAPQLGLSGTVDPHTFRRLLDGYAPEGGPALTQNAGRPDRQSGWDLTFSAPKSVSVMWALAPAAMRKDLEDAHRLAFEQALTQLEREAGVTRRGKGGHIKEPAALVFATFQHTTSRAQDPQLHTHAILINLGLRRDGTAGSIQSKNIFQAKMRTGALYQKTLATLLEQRLGLTIREDRVGFHIVGVPEALCHQFSQRRQAIQEELDRKGRHDAVAAKVATLDTRDAKAQVSRAELFARWQRVGQELGWAAEEVQALVRSPRLAQTAEQAPPHSTLPSAREETQSQACRADRPEEVRPRDQDWRESTAPPDGITDRELAAIEERMRQWSLAQGVRQSTWPNHDQQPESKPEWVRLFPHAPGWSPARKIKLPPQTLRQNLPRWRYILWRRRWRLGELRIQQRQLFRHTPPWIQLHRIKLPAIRFVPWYRLNRERRPVWGKINWRQRLGPVEVRVQRKRLFPKAPEWSPFSKFELPAVRIVQAVSNQVQNQQSQKDYSYGHSH